MKIKASIEAILEDYKQGKMGFGVSWTNQHTARLRH
jgi:hypothetical protein